MYPLDQLLNFLPTPNQILLVTLSGQDSSHHHPAGPPLLDGFDSFDSILTIPVNIVSQLSNPPTRTHRRILVIVSVIWADVEFPKCRTKVSNVPMRSSANC